MNTVDLKATLVAEGFDPRFFGIQENHSDETFCLDKRVDGKWAAYYLERGNRVVEQLFDSEHEACIYFLEWLRRTPGIKKEGYVK